MRVVRAACPKGSPSSERDFTHRFKERKGPPEGKASGRCSRWNPDVPPAADGWSSRCGHVLRGPAVRFIDEVTIDVAAGRGGDGCVAFHRHRHNPTGGHLFDNSYDAAEIHNDKMQQGCDSRERTLGGAYTC